MGFSIWRFYFLADFGSFISLSPFGEFLAHFFSIWGILFSIWRISGIFFVHLVKNHNLSYLNGLIFQINS